MKTCVALGTASLAAVSAQAKIPQITYQLLGLTSANAGQGIGFGYNPITFAIADTGETPGSVMGRSAYWPGKGFFDQSFIDGDYTGGSNQAEISLGPIAVGNTIGSSTTWSSRDFLSQGLDAYYGIRFDEGGGNYNYGWVEVSTAGNNLTFVAAGVSQTFNASILAGATPVPEPSTNVLLGLAGGGAALVALRRKRAAQTASRK